MFYVFGISFIYTFTIFLFLYSTYSLQVFYTFMFISFHVHILCMYHILSYLVYFHITYHILSCTFIYILIHLYVLILSYTLCFRILSVLFLYWFKTNTFISYLYFSYYMNFYLIFPISRRSIRLILLLSYHILSMEQKIADFGRFFGEKSDFGGAGKDFGMEKSGVKKLEKNRRFFR